MLKTPLIKLRKAAPGSLTAADVAAYMTRKRFPRTRVSVSAYEGGRIGSPPERFHELYAECIGQPVPVVRDAHRRSVGYRARAASPSAAKSVPQPGRRH